MAEQRFDVCVVGAGVAGIACAQGLARGGASVLLLDRLHPMPACLKAEKVDGEAVSALMRLGFQRAMSEALTPLRNVSVFFGERSLGTVPLDPPEGGSQYQVLINTLREHLDPRVNFRPGTKAAALEQREDSIDVVVDKATKFSCRLVIVATGDARHLLEPLGAKYQPQFPHQVFVSAFDMEGPLVGSAGPVDSHTYHRPISGAPVAYATFFRLGNNLRANIFCPGPITDEWQRDLKQRPLAVLAGQNRALASAAARWRATSPVMIRKLQVTKMEPPRVARVVALGDVAHTIDPSGGGGLTFSLMEAELFLRLYAPRWLKEEDLSEAAIQVFYNDPRRVQATSRFFKRGDYIFSLNHDASAHGHWRRLAFAVENKVASLSRGSRPHTALAEDSPWQLNMPYLYEQYSEANRGK